jgi:hypothetical protein
MKEGKVIFIESTKSINDNLIKQTENNFKNKNIKVVFAGERLKGFYTLSEATLYLAQKGIKKISAFPLSVGEKSEIPIFWGI